LDGDASRWRFAFDKPRGLWQIAFNFTRHLKVGFMATKQDRGTKRSCQNSECGGRFYDLNRSPIACPICGAAYVIASSPVAVAVVKPEEKTPRKPKKEEFAQTEASEDDAVEEDTLEEVEADETVKPEEDETFLEEEEEDGGDVTKIIGGTKAEGGAES